ncbi:MAG: transposase [Candidatus Thiosymbion ectosymbiont of Robbea hypermnestra]|nr:transposase [Candidatus Thiosymbion ectosymbiont of Robbea hypermnestra]
MSKGRYKSVEFKQVDWRTVRDRIAGERVVVAVDVAKEDVVATLLTADQEVLVTFGWRHPGETAAVLDRLVWLGRERRLEAVLEPSGTDGDTLVWQLRQVGVAVSRVSPKRVHDAAEVYDGVPSLHDAKAAYLIGRLHLQGISQPWPAPQEARRTVTAVLTQLRVNKARQPAASNRLEAPLSRHWPESLGLLGLDTVTLPTLLEASGDPASVAADAERAEALRRRTGRSGLRAEKIDAVLASAQRSLGVPGLAAARELLRWLAGDLLSTRREIRRRERVLAGQVKQAPALMPMAGIVGTVSAAVLVAAVGSPQSYPNARSYLKALGLNLKERSSGKHKGQLKITKRGPSLARFYLYFATLRLIAHEPVVMPWYQCKTSRPGAVKNQVVIALMRKLAQAVWHIAHGNSFDVNQRFAREAVAKT